MNKNLCKMVVENKERVVPFLFTERQIDIMKRWINGKHMNNPEKTYLYSSIRKKIEALSFLRTEFYQHGSDMIPKRVNEAKDILKEIGESRAFISGSFLFSKKYNDIDIYIISKRRRQYHKENRHFIHITEKDLEKPILQSAARYCVSTFEININKPLIKRMKFNDLVVNYETAIVEMLDKEEEKTTREVVFEYYLQLKKTVLNSHDLYTKTVDINNSKNKMEIINGMIKELLLKNYSRRYVYDELVGFVRRLKEDIKEFKANENLIIYKNLFEKIKDECRRAEIET